MHKLSKLAQVHIFGKVHHRGDHGDEDDQLFAVVVGNILQGPQRPVGDQTPAPCPDFADEISDDFLLVVGMPDAEAGESFPVHQHAKVTYVGFTGAQQSVADRDKVSKVFFNDGVEVPASLSQELHCEDPVSNLVLENIFDIFPLTMNSLEADQNKKIQRFGILDACFDAFQPSITEWFVDEGLEVNVLQDDALNVLGFLSPCLGPVVRFRRVRRREVKSVTEFLKQKP